MTPLFAQAAETTGAIVAQWGAPGAIIVMLAAALVWVTKQLLASNATIVTVLKEATAARSGDDEKNRAAMAKLTEAIQEQTRAQTASAQTDRDAIKANTDTVSKASAAVDALASEQRTTMARLIERRPPSTQNQQAVKA